MPRISTVHFKPCTLNFITPKDLRSWGCLFILCTSCNNIFANVRVLEPLMQLWIFSFYFHDQPDDGYALAETCSWLYSINLISVCTEYICRSQWPRGLRRRSSAARLLRSWVRVPPGAWMYVCCECCVLSGRGLCDGLITRPEESYRIWRVVVCGQETSKNEEAKTR